MSLRARARALPAVLVVLALPNLAAPVVPAAAKPTHHRICRDRRVLKVGGVKVCLPRRWRLPPNSARAGAAVRRTADTLLITPGFLRRLSKPLRRAVQMRPLIDFEAVIDRNSVWRSGVPGQSRPRPAATPSRRPNGRAADQVGHPSETGGGPPGGLDHSGVWYPPPGGVPDTAPGVHAVVEARPFTAPDGFGFGAQIRSRITDDKNPWLASGIDSDNGGKVSCPDRQGNAPGEFNEFQSKYTSAAYGGKVSYTRQSAGVRASFEAHVNDHAQATDYNASITIEMRVGGFSGVPGVPSPPSSSYRAFIELRHVPVAQEGPGFRDDLKWLSEGRYATKLMAWGPHGRLDEQPDDHFWQLVWEELAWAKASLERQIHTAQQSWGSANGCMSLRVDPARLSLRPGEQVLLRAHVASRRTGENTVPVELTLDPQKGYSVAPGTDVAGAGTPASFTITAPSSNPGGSASGGWISGVSRQGHVSGSVASIQFIDPSPRRYTVTSTGAASFQQHVTRRNDDGSVLDTSSIDAQPSWVTASSGLLLDQAGPDWLAAGPDSVVVTGQGTSTANGVPCHAPLYGSKPHVGLVVNWLVSREHVEFITGPAYTIADASNGSGDAGPCGITFGVLNPGGRLDLGPANRPAFNPIEALQAHFSLSRAELGALPVGGHLDVPLNGPASPLTVPDDCNYDGVAHYECTQSLSWHTNIRISRDA